MSGRRASHWLTALAISGGLHAAAYVALPHLTRPERPKAQATAETRARFEAMRVAQSKAEAATPESPRVAEDTAAGQTLAGGGIPTSQAAPVRPTSDVVPLQSPTTTAVSSTALPTTIAASARAAPNVAPSVAPTVLAANRVQPAGPALAGLRPPSDTAPAAALPDQAAPPADPDATQVALLTPDAPTTKARPAWQFGDRIVSDPTSLAVVQAFLPGADPDDSATELRDGLSNTLTGVDCARISARFDADTGTLHLSGHVPSPDMRAPVLAAMQAQVGTGIRVAGDLLHLPRPQCGALAGIAAAGLPQSTDQFTDTRLVGQAAHAREYRYSEGQRLGFDLTAPDYPAFVYVDFFDADGQVIHLVPNSFAPLEQHTAQSLFDVGRSGDLNITIGPPFGQEIAVAFAASSPLYDGLRPLREPAGPYLDFMKDRIAQARAADPGFKGEWVYFFVTTRAATQ